MFQEESIVKNILNQIFGIAKNMNLFDNIVTNIVLKYCYNVTSIFDIVYNIFCSCIQYYVNYYNVNYNIANNLVDNINNIVNNLNNIVNNVY